MWKSAFVALLVLASGAFSACSQDPGSGPGGEGSPSAGDGTVGALTIGTTAPNDAFTVFSESGAFGRMNYNAFVAAPFWTMDGEGKVKPFLVREWEIDPSSREITARVAVGQGISWHDGRPFTLEDVLFTFDYLMTRTRKSYVADLERVERLSGDSVKIVLKKPGAYQWIQLAAGYLTVLPRHVWENVEEPLKFSAPSAAIGCGPYRLVSVDRDADISVYEAVSESYLGRRLTVRKVILRTYASQDTLVMALKRGLADAMYDYSNALEATLAPGLQGVEGLDPGMSLNTGNFQIVYGFRSRPTSDLAFRKAATLALDYELLRVTIGGGYGLIPGIGVIAPPNIGFDPDLPRLGRDLAEAARALDEAGYRDLDGDGLREGPDGEPLEVSVLPQYNRVKSAVYLRLCEIVVRNLKDIGIRAALDGKGASNPDHNAALRKSGSYQIFLGYTSPGMARQTSAYYYFVDSSVTGQWGTCADPEFMRAYAERKEAADEGTYVALTGELQRINSRLYVAAPLCWNMAFFPYRTDRYEGWENYPGWGPVNAGTWYALRGK
ncbi:MAG: ABC transporter substrate-binding protein [Deltaproteobacteria bacterium]|jgi:peptide/nickel transport system substrate-binding protein|nr:ABC transporter substrate-binding protein [Deltaproteobacteria bacterium]